MCKDMFSTAAWAFAHTNMLNGVQYGVYAQTNTFTRGEKCKPSEAARHAYATECVSSGLSKYTDTMHLIWCYFSILSHAIK